MDSSAIPYTTIIGWTFIIGVGGACYYYNNYYNRNGRQSVRMRGTAPRPAANERQEPLIVKKPRKPKQSRPQQPDPAVVPTTSNPSTKEEKEDDSWAHALAERKNGTKFSSKKNADSGKLRSVKQNKARAKSTDSASGPSSTTGGEADDDLSPAMSPSLPAIESQAFSSSNDVSDMLEASSAGPSVLSIKAPAQSAYTRPKQAPRPVQKEETKKDRQNRLKREAQKLETQEREKERKALEEKQRRTAREARGEPAKNGLASAKPPSSSAWANGNGVATPKPAFNGDLLDTTLAPQARSVPTKGMSNGNGTHGNNWWAGDHLPSEEEQERILKENDDSAWTSVVDKKKKKKVVSQAPGSVIEDDSSEHSGVAAPAVQSPSEPGGESGVLDYSVHGTYNGSTVPESAWTVA
jgi:hypothetical protein